MPPSFSILSAQLMAHREAESRRKADDEPPSHLRPAQQQAPAPDYRIQYEGEWASVPVGEPSKLGSTSTDWCSPSTPRGGAEEISELRHELGEQKKRREQMRFAHALAQCKLNDYHQKRYANLAKMGRAELERARQYTVSLSTTRTVLNSAQDELSATRKALRSVEAHLEKNTTDLGAALERERALKAELAEYRARSQAVVDLLNWSGAKGLESDS